MVCSSFEAVLESDGMAILGADTTRDWHFKLKHKSTNVKSAIVRHGWIVNVIVVSCCRIWYTGIVPKDSKAEWSYDKHS